jgi:circadian clock protein KaiB
MKPPEVDQMTKTFEDAVTALPHRERYWLRLFVTGSAPKSIRAIQNIRALCDKQLFGRYDLEVVDVYQHPERAEPEQIVVTPTLVKQLPLPLRKIIGDLSDTQKVLAGLDIVTIEATLDGGTTRHHG